MPEPMDLFSDALHVYMGPFGCAIHYSLSEAQAHFTSDPGVVFSSNRVATVRMTPELMKGLAWILYHEVKKYENQGVRIELPPPYVDGALRSAGVDREYWDRFWGYTQT